MKTLIIFLFASIAIANSYISNSYGYCDYDFKTVMLATNETYCKYHIEYCKCLKSLIGSASSSSSYQTNFDNCVSLCSAHNCPNCLEINSSGIIHVSHILLLILLFTAMQN